MKRSDFIFAILFFCMLFTAKPKIKANDNGYFMPDCNILGNTTNISLSTFGITPNLITNDQLLPENNSWVFAGNDTTICLSGAWFTVNGTASNYLFCTWISGGDGFFADANDLSTEYFPGLDDKINGQVRLILIIYCEPPDFEILSDTVIYTIVLAPYSNAGPDGLICENESFQPSGFVSNYSAMMWTTSGDGFFENPNQINANYYPGQIDIDEGSTVLCLAALPNSPCLLPSANCMTLFIQKLPSIENLNDTTVCSGGILNLTPTINNCNSIVWSTEGDGIFSDPQIPNPDYYPGVMDSINGQVELHLSATSGCICNQTLIDSMMLTFQPHPIIYAGPNQNVCIGDTIRLFGEGNHYSSFFWLSYGDGVFDNPYIINPKYIPGEIDCERGFVFLEIIVNAITPCNIFTGSYLIVTIHRLAEANAGNDETICDDAVFELQATASNHSSLQWTSGGDGTFSNPNSLNTNYSPGILDLQTGFALLTLTLQPDAPCTMTTQDQMMLTFAKSPVATAGEDHFGCEQIQLAATAQHYETVIWSTSGDGTFSDLHILNPIYHAGTADKSNGYVQLIFIAQPVLPCSVSSSDELTFFIDNPTVLSETIEDYTVFSGENIEMEFIAQSYSQGTYSWFRNDLLIPNSNTSVLILTQIGKLHAGVYHCEFENDCSEIISSYGLLSVLEPTTQVFVLPAGWSSSSSFVMPSDPGIATIFQPIIDELEIVINFEGAYWPGANLNTLGNWDIETGYSIKMDSPQILTISGVIKYPIDPIILESGWSFLPVKSTCPINVEDTFGSYNEVLIIKEVSGTKVFWPAMQIKTLEFLQPGKSYHIFKTGDSMLEVLVPECSD